MDDLELNTVGMVAKLVHNSATPLKNKRKGFNDEATPRSRHIDKKSVSRGLANDEDITEIASLTINSEEPSKLHLGSNEANKASYESSVPPEPSFKGAASIGSIMSRAESVLPDGDEADAIETTNAEISTTIGTNQPEHKSPVDAPSVGDLPESKSTHSSTNDVAATPISSRLPGRIHLSELDLLSFQTPAPPVRRQNSPELRRFIDARGEELLLDVTPRVYSPRSIPIYTLHDLEKIKSDFDESRAAMEQKILGLREELAQSVNNAVHHRALAAQGESLHTEYSKKHVRKVTALKTEWERKNNDRIAQRDKAIIELQETIVQLKATLEQERMEKREVIEMAEAVLKMAVPNDSEQAPID